MVPFIDHAYRTLPDAAHRGLAGHSSGGYGAMVNAMRRPELFGGFATHAGDGLFEALRDHYDGSFDAFWADFRSRPGRPRPTDGNLINIYCMAACFSTDGDGTIRFPFDLTTGRLIPDIWDRWLALDPVRMASTADGAAALRRMSAIWIDAGRSDEYNLDLAAIAFHRAVVAAGPAADAVRFELFDGGHTNAAWRYPLALAWLAERLRE